jgi:hypothetical protein
MTLLLSLMRLIPLLALPSLLNSSSLRKQSASCFLPARTLQPSPSDLSVHPANPFPLARSLQSTSPPLLSQQHALSAFPAQPDRLPAMLDLTTLFLLPDFYSLPAPLSPPDNMHSLLSLHNLTRLPAMLDLTYLEYSAFGEG